MRDYENSDTSSFNSYRSGNENPRRENSTRTDFGGNASVTRRGSNLGTSDHYQQNSVWHQPQDYRDLRNQQGGGNQNQQNDWIQNRNQNQGNNWDRQHQPGWDRNNNWNQGHQDRWPQDNRQHMTNYGNHSQDRDWDRHRSGDRNFFEQAGDRIQETWNRWTDDDRDNYNNTQNQYRGSSNYQNQNRQGNNYGQNRTSGDYSQNRGNMGRQYDENRYAQRRDNDFDNRHDDRNEEGFFDRVGSSIRNAWNSFTEEEREDQNRANRYEQRNGLRSDQNRRTSNRSDEGNDGPPYSWGSSSSEDYRW